VPAKSQTREVATVVVDAENVRRSLWPNMPREELVSRVRSWAAEHGHEPLVVFDGRAPGDAPDLVSSGRESADDWIAREALRLGRPWWLVTSDRGLRARVDPDRFVGGGSFARELRAGS
jgi:hypothetical protein